MTARTVNGSIKIREKHKIFKETGSPFDATPIHSIKVRVSVMFLEYWGNRWHSTCVQTTESNKL